MAAINKNFVIKNGLEVDTNLILADSQTNKVGIGTTVPQYLLHVNGGIGVTNLYVSGIATITTGIVTNLTSTNLNVTGIGTIVTGNITNLTNTNLNVTGIATIATLNATGIAVTNFTVYNNLSVGGISTFTNGPVLIGSGTSTGTASQRLQVTGGTYVSGNLGIGSTNPTSKLNVIGDVRVTGVITATTFSGNVNAGVGTITTLGSTNGTITNLTGTAGTITTFNSTSGTITNLTGTSGTITTFNSTNGTITNLTGTAGTITTLNSTNGTITNLNVTGISTLGTVRISSGIITATSGIVTYFGDGNFLNLTSNPSRGIGIGTTGGVVGYAVTFINFKGSGVSTTQYNSSTGIATIFFEGGGGGGGSISISTTAPLSPGSGDLWYSPDYGRTFIYYDESVVGYGTDAFWVDAAPFNVGIITSLSGASVAFFTGSAVSPSMSFVGDNQTGFFSPGSGQFTVVSTGSSILNVNASGINITGIVTATSLSVSGNVSIAGTLTYDDVTNVDSIGLITARTGIQVLAGGINITGIATFTNASGTVKIGIGTTALLVEGNARVTGILTVGSSSITLNGSTNVINVGTGLTLSSSGINVTGVITATSFVGNGSGLTGIANTANIVSTAITTGILNVGTGITVNASGINVTGVVTATSFFGNGSGLTGAGSTVFDDTTTNQEFFPLFTATTSGTITASGISTSKLTYNPSTGAMTAVDFNSTSDINLKENIHTVGNALEITEQLRGVSFDWKETGRSSYGVIAQELEEVLPELVKQGDVKSVNYNGIIGVLIEAIKELKKEIEDLKNAK